MPKALYVMQWDDSQFRDRSRFFPSLQLDDVFSLSSRYTPVFAATLIILLRET
jgi:hypothetical protein